jgi:hypothetical protein
MDDGLSYGLDAIYHGRAGQEPANAASASINRRGVKSKVLQTGDGGWAVRLGPVDHRTALDAVERFMAGDPANRA